MASLQALTGGPQYERTTINKHGAIVDDYSRPAPNADIQGHHGHVNSFGLSEIKSPQSNKLGFNMSGKPDKHADKPTDIITKPSAY